MGIPIKNNSDTGLSKTVVRAEKYSEGTTKRFPNVALVLTIGGTQYTVAAVQANLQEIVSLRAATTAAQADAKKKVADERARRPALVTFLQDYGAFLRGTFGNSADALADFDIQPKKPRKPLTTEQKAAAKAKAKATREARGTKGPVAKLKTVGNVVGVTVTPITTAASVGTAAGPQQAAPAPAPQPAAASTAASPVTPGSAPHA
jgi:hypothetical protein